MRSAKRPRRGHSVIFPGALAAGLVLLCLSGLVGGTPSVPPAAAQTPDGPGKILFTTGPGGVLTADGMLWVYRPDQETWLSIDQAFKNEGKETKILPLPVPVEKIQDMSTWGFFLTTEGELWIYDLAADTWKALPPPPAS